MIDALFLEIWRPFFDGSINSHVSGMQVAKRPRAGLKLSQADASNWSHEEKHNESVAFC
jgi:hypothetical protein